MEQYYPFQMEPLDYRLSDLEPALDLQTVMIHYGAQQGRADRLNDVLERWPGYQGWGLSRLLSRVERLPRELREPVRQLGGGLYNHIVYFSSMTAPAGQQPEEVLAGAIREGFGSPEGLRQRFAQAAEELPGVGWVWLVTDRQGRLQVIATRDEETPLARGVVPLFCCDLWEHAYFLQYKTHQDRYRDAWWGLVDWQKAEERYRQRNLPPEPGTAPHIYG